MYILAKEKRIPVMAAEAMVIWSWQSLKFSLKAPCAPLLLTLKYKCTLHGIKKMLLLPEFPLSNFSVSHTVFFKQDAERMVACSLV